VLRESSFLPRRPLINAKLSLTTTRKRQYVYRLQVWGATKYKNKKGHPDNHPGGSGKAARDEPEEATPRTNHPIAGSPPTTFHQM
jgi:hypothetical protein